MFILIKIVIMTVVELKERLTEKGVPLKHLQVRKNRVEIVKSQIETLHDSVVNAVPELNGAYFTLHGSLILQIVEGSYVL